MIYSDRIYEMQERIVEIDRMVMDLDTIDDEHQIEELIKEQDYLEAGLLDMIDEEWEDYLDQEYEDVY